MLDRLRWSALLLLAAEVGIAAVIDIVAPTQISVVNVGAIIVAEVDPAIPRSQIRSVTFAWSRDLATWVPITGPAPDGIARHAVLWNAEDLTPGTYYLRASVIETSGLTSHSPVVNTRLNAQPVARATVQPTGTPFRVRYNASSSYDPDGSISSFEWDFGDGTRGSGPIIEHQFTGPGAYGISMTVTDDSGGTATRHTVLAVAAQGFLKEKNKNTCGCSKMTVKFSGDVEGPASLDFSGGGQRFPAGEIRKLGPFQTPATGDQLDLTKDDFFVKSRFEVIADLKDKSKPQLCEEGQRVQQTGTDDGVSVKKGADKPADERPPLSSDPRYDSEKSDTDPFNGKKNGKGICGVGDPNWCDDDYHGGGNARGAGKGDDQPSNAFKKYEDEKRILWLDAPGARRVFKKEIQDHGVSYSAQYEAIVSGPNGADACKCSWDVSFTISKTGQVTRNKPADTLKCTP